LPDRLATTRVALAQEWPLAYRSVRRMLLLHAPRRRCRVALFITSMTAIPIRAAADPNQASTHFAWVRGEGATSCPPADAVRDNVARRLGYNPFGESASRSFEVVASHAGEWWTARIYLNDSARRTSGFREIQSDGDECGALVNAVALALALAIDPEAALAPRAANPPPGAAPPPAAYSRDPVTPPLSSPLRPTPSSTRPAFAFRALLSPNLLPSWAPGVAISADLQPAARLAVAAGGWFFPSVLASTPTARFGFGLTAAWLDACAVLVEHPTDLRVCAGPRVGALHAVVYSPAPTSPGDRVWWAAAAGFALKQQLGGRAFVEGGLEADFPLARYRFYVQNSGTTVFQQSAVVGLGFFGLGFRVD
jgi:hypothetical protein